jgi:hypothetical protein
VRSITGGACADKKSTGKKSQGLSTLEDASPWYCLDEHCIYCGKDDYTETYGPRTLVMCTACTAGAAHVGCYQDATGRELPEGIVSSSDWFCSEVRHTLIQLW